MSSISSASSKNNINAAKQFSSSANAKAKYAQINSIPTSSTSTYTTGSNISNSLYSTNLNYGINTAGYFNTQDFSSFNLDHLLMYVAKYLSEDEIDTLLTNLLDREGMVANSTSSGLKTTIQCLVRVRHFSEDFLMKYYDYLSKEDILALHTPDITSGVYSQLALLLTNDDNKNDDGSAGLFYTV